MENKKRKLDDDKSFYKKTLPGKRADFLFKMMSQQEHKDLHPYLYYEYDETTGKYKK